MNDLKNRAAYIGAGLLLGEVVSLIILLLSPCLAQVLSVSASNPYYKLSISAAVSFMKNLLPLLILRRTFGIKEDLVLHKSDKPRPKLNFVLLYGVIALLLCIALNFLMSFGKSYSHESTYGQYGIMYDIFSIAVLALVPAMFEETAYRGIILGILDEYGTGFAMLVSAILFAVSHGSILAMVYAFLCGLILGYLYIKTQSLCVCVVTHFLSNAFVAAYDILYRNGIYLGRLPLYICMVAVFILTVVLILLKGIRRIRLKNITSMSMILAVNKMYMLFSTGKSIPHLMYEFFSRPWITAAVAVFVLVGMINCV